MIRKNFPAHPAINRETNLDSDPACMILAVTHLNTQAYFPAKIVFDFGGDCLRKDGSMRNGKMISTYTGRLTVPASSAITIFHGFKIVGTYTLSNITAAIGYPRQCTVYE